MKLSTQYDRIAGRLNVRGRYVRDHTGGTQLTQPGDDAVLGVGGLRAVGVVQPQCVAPPGLQIRSMLSFRDWAAPGLV